MTSFNQLGLSNQVLKAVAELGFETPTEIQQQAIPQLLQKDTDFIGLAQTGTGKTAAFGLPLLERMDPQDKSTQALILAPTRELGQQIAEQLNIFSKYLDRVNVLPVYGGAPISGQLKALRRPQQVIIATPGRLIDLIKRKAIHLDQLRYLILDEADEMLNMGFKEDLDRILSYTPKQKQTWLFSATMPNEIRRIVKTYMNNPIEVKVNTKNEVNANIDHQYVTVHHSDKTEALTRFLDTHPKMRGLVFCRTKRETQKLADILSRKNYRADALHGDMSQSQRDRVMKRFKSFSLQVLVATDVAARGIDVNDITHVFHHSLPDDDSYYTHRSGRTARAGKDGISISFINGKEHRRIGSLERQLGISFEKVSIPQVSDIADQQLEGWMQKVLDQKTRGNLDPELAEKAHILFGGLSKEELINKMMVMELEKLNLGESKDLNEEEKRQSSSHRSHSRGRSSQNRGGKPFNNKGKGKGKGNRQRKRRYSN